MKEQERRQMRAETAEGESKLEKEVIDSEVVYSLEGELKDQEEEKVNVRRVEELKKKLKSVPEKTTVSREEKVHQYIEQHLPARLDGESLIGKTYTAVGKIYYGALEKLGLHKVEGREKAIKTGGCLLVANHARFFDEAKIAAAVDRTAVIVGADMHYKNPLKRIFMNMLGTIEVKASFKNLDAQEKEDLLKRVSGGERKYYQEVMERDEQPMDRRALKEFLETTVATLASGRAVTLFPEGLWTHQEEGNVMRKAYGGIETIAREYKRVTGEDLPITPIAIKKRGIEIGSAVTLKRGDTVHDVMKRIAEMLPEELQGYYKKEV